MGVFNKLKNVLFDIEEEEIPVITRDDKTTTVKEENPIKEVKMPKDDFTDEIKQIEPIATKKDTNFNFPLDDFEDDIPVRPAKRDYFDEDYTTRTSLRENRKREESKKNDNYEYDYSRLNVRESSKKNDTKPFKPSPVISPVYGILDQNYTKDDVIVKSDVNNRSSKSPSLDDVRKKAYGKKEEVDEFEEPLRTLDEILIDKEEIIPKPKKKTPIIEEEPVLDKNEPIGVYDDELPDEPYADEVIDKKSELVIDKEDSLESDLFNLIDSMYEDRNEREEDEE